MGKKPQKTKDLWAAIAESSTTIDDTQQPPPHQPQPQATRKRGRPRKIIVKMENAEEKASAQPILIEQPATEEVKHEGTTSSTCTRVTEEEGVSEEIQLIPKGEPLRSSRARRKSKPRKSSTQ